MNWEAIHCDDCASLRRLLSGVGKAGKAVLGGWQLQVIQTWAGNRMRLQFRGEVFNMFNYPNFRANSPTNQFDDPGAGHIRRHSPRGRYSLRLMLIY
jgi:hypothetical protein